MNIVNKIFLLRAKAIFTNIFRRYHGYHNVSLHQWGTSNVRFNYRPDDDPESRDHFNAQVLAPFLFSVGLKTESIRKSSNFNFQWTRTLYQNILNNIYIYVAFVFYIFQGL